MTVEKISKVIVGIVIAYAVYFVVDAAIYSHSIITDNKEWKDYMYLFQDSIVNDVDTLTAGTYVRKIFIQALITYPGFLWSIKTNGSFLGDDRLLFILLLFGNSRTCQNYRSIVLSFVSISHWSI